MLNTTRILQDGALLSFFASTFLLLVLRFNPRVFLGHYPREIRRIVPPRSEKERRTALLLGVLIVAPVMATLLWRTATLGSRSFWDQFGYAFGVLFIFNLVDLLILDWLIVCRFRLRWAILPGTEHIVVPNPYLHHFKEFVIGTVGLVIVGLAMAAFLSVQF